MKLEDFHQITSGEGEKWLIFLHGLMGMAANWRRIIPAFEKNFKILAFDQRGHGRSFHPEVGYTPEDFAGDLKFIMDELKIPKASIIGHSMGGRNALVFSHLYPSKVEKLVIEDVGASPGEKYGTGLIKLLKSIPAPFESKVKAKEYLLNDLGDPRMGNFFYSSMKVDSQGKMDWAVDIEKLIQSIQNGMKRSFWPEVEGLKMPTLIIRGEKSDVLSKSEFEKMIKANSNIKGVEIKDAGHWVHFDQPDAFISVCLDFLDAK